MYPSSASIINKVKLWLHFKRSMAGLQKEAERILNIQRRGTF